MSKLIIDTSVKEVNSAESKPAKKVRNGKTQAKEKATTQPRGGETAMASNNTKASKRATRAHLANEANGRIENIIINGFAIQINTILDSHGWITIEDVKLPYVVRGGVQKFIPLCIIEKTLLKPYPGPYPEKELGRAPMMGFYLTTEEVRLLNRFVMQSYTQKIGFGRFSLKNMLVTLPDFIDFYQKVKSIQHLCPRVVAAPKAAPLPEVQGGWAQVNNTIVPYVLRNRVKMAPLSVVQFAAGLLKEVEVPSLGANEDECTYLNEACAEVGMDFQFSEDTRLLELFLVPTLSKSRVAINELPKKDPLQHARFMNRSNDRRSVFVAASVRSQEISKQDQSDTNGPMSPDIKPIKKESVDIKPLKKEEPVNLNENNRKRKSKRSPKTSPAIPPELIKQPQAAVKQDIKIIQVPASSSVMPPTVSPPQQAPAPQIIQVPMPGLKICPQHGFRGVLLPNGGVQQAQPSPAPVILQPQIIGAANPPVNVLTPQGAQPQAPIMVIRLNGPLPDNRMPIILSPTALPRAQEVQLAVQPQPQAPQLIQTTPVKENGAPVVIKIEDDDNDDTATQNKPIDEIAPLVIAPESPVPDDETISNTDQDNDSGISSKRDTPHEMSESDLGVSPPKRPRQDSSNAQTMLSTIVSQIINSAFDVSSASTTDMISELSDVTSDISDTNTAKHSSDTIPESTDKVAESGEESMSVDKSDAQVEEVASTDKAVEPAEEVTSLNNVVEPAEAPKSVYKADEPVEKVASINKVEIPGEEVTSSEKTVEEGTAVTVDKAVAPLEENKEDTKENEPSENVDSDKTMEEESDDKR